MSKEEHPDVKSQPSTKEKSENPKKRPQPDVKNEEAEVPNKVKKVEKDSKNHEKNEENDKIKWHYIEHHGVLFPDLYIPAGLKIKVKVNISLLMFKRDKKLLLLGNKKRPVDGGQN
jgi:hypothetical protein